jgi:glycosyltransferase involved in cell wall biosynthesis
VRILFVTTRYPWPATRGNQLRTTQWIDWLATRHTVTLVTPKPRQSAPPPTVPGLEIHRLRRSAAEVAWSVARALAGSVPLQAGLYRSRELHRLLPVLARRHDLGIAQLVRLAMHLEDFGGLPLIADLVDSLSLNFERRAEFDAPWRAPLWRLEARRLDRAEQRFVERAGRSVVVCERDRADLVGRLGTRAAQRLRVLPLAIAPSEERPAREPSSPPLLVITGNLGYFPTAEGIEWWLRAVWPEVRRRFEGVRLRLSGARPSRSLERLARAAGAELQASPPDLRAVLREATIALAPARCGSGLPLKVLEAWAQGVPVVATRWTASGAAAVADRDLLVADTPAEWVAALGRLLGDRTLGVRLVRCGREKLRAEYDARQLASSLDALVEEVAARG